MDIGKLLIRLFGQHSSILSSVLLLQCKLDRPRGDDIVMLREC